MPVKIRCKCDKVLSAPDKARGKVIQCPECGTKLRVPGEAAPQPVAAPAPSGKKKAAKEQSQFDSGEFIARMDLGSAESTEDRVCPYCAADMEEDQAICRECGMNVDTGRMDAKEQKKRSRKGIDPALFYKNGVSDAWNFLITHWSLVFKTCNAWTVFMFLMCGCGYMAFGYSTRIPPIIFWSGLTLLSLLGYAGYFWWLTQKVVDATMHKDEKAYEYLHFDLFQCISIGLRAILWPMVMLIPLVPVIVPVAMVMAGLGAAVSGDLTGLGIGFFLVVGLMYLFPAFIFPLALVHMTQKYTYKAWILWEMLKVALPNLAPTFFWWAVGLVVSIPAIIMGVVVGFFGALVGGLLANFTYNAADWIMGVIDQSDPESWMFLGIRLFLILLIAGCILWPVNFILSIPAVFMMRMTGSLGLYNRDRLGLVNHINPDTPANFWVRVLAHLVDRALVPLASILVVKEPKAIMLAWLINGIAIVTRLWLPPYMMIGVFVLWPMYMYWMYFAVQESTTTRTTIGKDAFGLIVNDLSGKQMTLGQASKRVIGRWLCDITFGLGYLIVAFHPKKRGLHDMVAGSQCCWRGDR